MLNYSKKLDRRIFIPILIILAIFFLATTMQTSFAATNSINNTTTDGISGALSLSNPGDTIELDEGIYTGSNNRNININKNITIQGKTKDKVILDAQGLSRMFYTSAANINVTIINITFINGFDAYGGAIDVGIAHFDIINCDFINNSVAHFGGAISVNGYYGSSSANILNCNFINNSATEFGGAIASQYDGLMTITGCNFINNTANFAGAIINFEDSNMIVINSNFNNNHAAQVGSTSGGAIVNTHSNLTIINSNFNNNSAVHGGAVYTIGNGNVNVIDSNFTNNHATKHAGGIFNSGTSTGGISNLNVSNSNFINNSAEMNGGAISNYGNTSIINSNFSNNSANGMGNAIYNNISAGSTNNGSFLIIEGNIIVDNSANDKDNIFNDNGNLLELGNNIISYITVLTINTNALSNRVTITATATDKSGNVIVGATINFYVNGVLVGSAITNSEGITEFTYNVSSVGVQNILAYMPEFNVTNSLATTSIHLAATNTTSINVAKTNTNATIIVSNAAAGKQTIVRGVLVDDNGNPIAGASLNVVIGGKSYSVVTGADGKWELLYTPSKAGSYNAKVYYNGDTNYLASTGSVGYTVAQEQEDTPTKVDIRLVKRNNSKAVRHGNVVYMKWLTFKNFGASGSQTINAKIIIKNLKYKLWKVYNKKLNYKFAKNNIKFKLNLKSNGLFKLKLKVYRPIKQK